MTDISARLGSMALRTCVFNAAGPKDVTLDELETIGKSRASAIVMKSCTLEPRQGNEEPRYSDVEKGSINSMGLPNLGYREYVKFADALKKHGKPVIASVSGLCTADNVEIIKSFNDSPVDAIELNLSCPNIKGKPQIGYDFAQMDEVLRETTKMCKKPIGVKLPPYFDFVHFEEAARILKKHNPAFITCINSIGNALVIDADKESTVIRPKGGFGGLGGAYIKPTALANARKFYELTGGKIPIVGVGGVFTGRDAFEFILAGATAVQIGTAFMQEGAGVFERVADELMLLLKTKGYDSLDDFRGKLKTC
ncbi:MAG: dihydroorotate oxidase [Candidatus Aenigmarchaeota archaeon]|nr:dihydroorotate oxidase [Candidatus Aenigmarchaeota archaeon]